MDIVSVARGAAVECERQKVGLKEVGFLLEAYLYTVKVRDESIAMNDTTFEVLGSLVEPGKNRYGYRKVPVTFANGGSSANASEVPRLMITLRDNIKATEYGRNAAEADHITREFLWTHPFADGNGRVGWLLYNYLMNTLDSPLPLPDFFA